MLDADDDIRGYWVEMTSLMLVTADSLLTRKSFVCCLNELLNDGKWTSTGDWSNLSISTISLGSGHDRPPTVATGTPTREREQSECEHSTDCLPGMGAIAMMYYRDYEMGKNKAFCYDMAGCRVCMDICKIYHAILDLALHGCTKKQILNKESYANLNLCKEVKELFNSEDESSSPLITVLKKVLRVFNDSNNIEEGILMLDENKTCALFGQLAGAYYGLTDIKEDWLDCLQSKEMLTDITSRLLDKIRV